MKRPLAELVLVPGERVPRQVQPGLCVGPGRAVEKGPAGGYGRSWIRRELHRHHLGRHQAKRDVARQPPKAVSGL
jgi:hypothetical protein